MLTSSAIHIRAKRACVQREDCARRPYTGENVTRKVLALVELYGRGQETLKACQRLQATAHMPRTFAIQIVAIQRHFLLRLLLFPHQARHSDADDAIC